MINRMSLCFICVLFSLHANSSSIKVKSDNLRSLKNSDLWQKMLSNIDSCEFSEMKSSTTSSTRASGANGSGILIKIRSTADLKRHLSILIADTTQNLTNTIQNYSANKSVSEIKPQEQLVNFHFLTFSEEKYDHNQPILFPANIGSHCESSLKLDRGQLFGKINCSGISDYRNEITSESIDLSMYINGCLPITTTNTH